jgi:hypothetical protein
MRRATTGPAKAVRHSKAERRKTHTPAKRPNSVRTTLLWLVVLGTCSALIYAFSTWELPSASSTRESPPTTVQP